jgi:hypothetical protein
LRQTTLNVLVTLGDAFITAYLVGARQFGTSDLRVTAARIMGMESDHRTLARVLAPDVASQDGGPIEKLTGVQGVAEPVDPPNNNAYERTLCWTHIQQAVTALTPSGRHHCGGRRLRRFEVGFDPLMPKLPNPLGGVIPFKGC